MNRAVILLLVYGLVGCGTVTTLSSSDEQVRSRLKKKDTYCEFVPRTYSGVAYDFCTLNSKPIGTDVEFLGTLYLIDGVLSAAADTLALPYTVVQQSKRGSIRIDG